MGGVLAGGMECSSVTVVGEAGSYWIRCASCQATTGHQSSVENARHHALLIGWDLHQLVMGADTAICPVCLQKREQAGRESSPLNEELMDRWRNVGR